MPEGLGRDMVEGGVRAFMHQIVRAATVGMGRVHHNNSSLAN